MEYLCKSCGKKFKERGSSPPCPSCLSKNVIMAVNEKGSKNFSRSHRPNKEVIFTVVLGVGVGLLLIFFGEDKKKSSKAARWKLPDSITSAQLIKNTASDAKFNTVPYFDGQKTILGKAKKLGRAENVVLFILDRINVLQKIGSLVPDTPAVLLKKLESGKTNSSTLSFALLGKALLDALEIENYIIDTSKSSLAGLGVPVWIGRYGLSYKTRNSGFKQVDFLQPSRVISKFRSVNTNEILALLVVATAMDKVGGDPLALRFLVDPISTKNQKTVSGALNLIRAAKQLAPRSAAVFACGAWVHHRLGLPKPAAKYAEIVLSLSDTQTAKSFTAMFRVIRKDVKGAKALLENSSAKWTALRAYCALGVDGPDKALTFLPLIKPEHGEAGDFVSSMVMSVAKEPSTRKNAIPILKTSLKIYPRAQWPVMIAFNLYSQLKMFPEARKLVPRLTKTAKNPGVMSESILEKIDKMEKSAVSALQEEKKAIK
jgi:DNA-directed RNA polymerase subunit RPC12/RpoP